MNAKIVQHCKGHMMVTIRIEKSTFILAEFMLQKDLWQMSEWVTALFSHSILSGHSLFWIDETSQLQKFNNTTLMYVRTAPKRTINLMYKWRYRLFSTFICSASLSLTPEPGLRKNGSSPDDADAGRGLEGCEFQGDDNSWTAICKMCDIHIYIQKQENKSVLQLLYIYIYIYIYIYTHTHTLEFNGIPMSLNAGQIKGIKTCMNLV